MVFSVFGVVYLVIYFGRNLGNITKEHLERLNKFRVNSVEIRLVPQTTATMVARYMKWIGHCTKLTKISIVGAVKEGFVHSIVQGICKCERLAEVTFDDTTGIIKERTLLYKQIYQRTRENGVRFKIKNTIGVVKLVKFL